MIKLRPLDPDDVSGDVRRLSGFDIEVDAIPGGFVCSGRLKCEADSDAIRQVVLGERPLRLRDNLSNGWRLGGVALGFVLGNRVLQRFVLSATVIVLAISVAVAVAAVALRVRLDPSAMRWWGWWPITA